MIEPVPTQLVRRAVCPYDCPDTCGMLVVLKDGQPIALKGDPGHPFTDGYLCHKVTHDLERLRHPERLLYPQRRVGPKGAGRFERITWDDALSEIAERFQKIAAGQHGAQAILPYSYCGTMGKIQGESLDRRFFHRLGASRLDRTICAAAGSAGYRYTIGSGQGMHPLQFANSRHIINWGANPAVTNVHLWTRMLDARKRGAKLVCIDPYRCLTAERSDWHLMPRPGTDAALALGVMHVLFRDNLHDEGYLKEYCLGAEKLRERVLNQYSPAQVSRITGLETGEIEQLATEYAQSQPAAIRINYGMQRHAGGGMAVRTIACLPAVSGSWRHPAGGILLSTSWAYQFDFARLQRPDLSPPGTRTVNMVQLADALHGEIPGPPVEALYVYNSNPAAVAPDQRRVLDGLRREDLYTVVHEQFATDTADYADLLLPATMQLEHFDLHHSYGHYWVQVNEPCAAAPGECRSNNDVFRAMADRMGFEAEIFQVSDEQLAREALWETDPEHRPALLTGITLDKLRTEGPQKLNVDESTAPYAEGGFATPSGKCELYCERMTKIGLDPLAGYVPPDESPATDSDRAERYPLQLLSPPSKFFLNSTFVNVDRLRQSEPEPRLILNPDDARSRQIKTGELVKVWNDRGVFHARAEVADDVRAGVAVAPSIWWNKYAPDGVNANVTTSSRLSDIAGGATFFDNLVEVARVEHACDER